MRPEPRIPQLTGELHQHIQHIRKRLDLIRFGAGHDAVENGSGLPAVVAAQKHSILTADRDRPYHPFAQVVVDRQRGGQPIVGGGRPRIVIIHGTSLTGNGLPDKTKAAQCHGAFHLELCNMRSFAARSAVP